MRRSGIYRPCAGAMIINKYNQVWLGKRLIKSDNPKNLPLWQMPQGGIDNGEKAEEAVYREVYEETGIKNLTIIYESKNWYYYDIPDNFYENPKGNFVGQKQKWFLMFFSGADEEINLIPDKNMTHHQEFSEWKWELRDNIIDQVIEFKKETYLKVLEEFKGYNIYSY
ncbi:MAG: RNA pyrophosphohydrolase [Rhizobiales bacterium TMED28]|nr:RNA pyrophosphohydrolase [Rhodobiaceae bacterium]OUT82142.1 MAG: RNA pyrophosphohydrolase [Rhizobiales bacterium TMED28]